MTRYRPTTLRLASRHCPRAVDHYEQGRPYPREHFAVGVAAHAVLEALGHAAVRWRGEGACLPPDERVAIADAVAKQLMATGRTFDGAPEPPLPPDAVIEGRDLALRYALANPLSPTARYELGAGFDLDWAPVGYDDPRARFRLIFDVLDPIEESDEESAAMGLLVRDYKSAWSTDAAELDTLQMKAQAVCAKSISDESPAWLDGADIRFIRQEVVNLRTGQTYSRTIWIDGMGVGTEVDGAALLAGWQRDITMAMDALDVMQAVPLTIAAGDQVLGVGTLTFPRPARPGTGCAGCAWIASCEPAQAYMDETKTPMHPEGISRLLATAQAHADVIKEIARRVLDDHGPVEMDGYRVGTVATAQRTPVDDAGIKLLDKWQQGGGDARGLLKALKPGVASLESAAKVLLPGKEQRLARDELVASLTRMKIGTRFGVHKIGEEG